MLGAPVCLARVRRRRWRADAIARRPLGHVFAADIELIGRREIVERGIPFRARIGLCVSTNSPVRAGHSQWLGPRIEFVVLDDLEDAGNRKIVVADRVALAGSRRSSRVMDSSASRQWPIALSGCDAMFVNRLVQLLLDRRQGSAAGRPRQVWLSRRDFRVRRRATSERECDPHLAQKPAHPGAISWRRSRWNRSSASGQPADRSR